VNEPALEVTKELMAKVERMAATGLNLIQIGMALGLSEKTIRNYKKRHPELQEAWARGKWKAVTVVSNALFEKATEDKDVNAIKFYLTHQGGDSWKEKIDVNLVPKPMIIERYASEKEVVLGTADSVDVEDAEIK
jgi:hypothetical protein